MPPAVGWRLREASLPPPRLPLTTRHRPRPRRCAYHRASTSASAAACPKPPSPLVRPRPICICASPLLHAMDARALLHESSASPSPPPHPSCTPHLLHNAPPTPSLPSLQKPPSHGNNLGPLGRQAACTTASHAMYAQLVSCLFATASRPPRWTSLQKNLHDAWTLPLLDTYMAAACMS